MEEWLQTAVNWLCTNGVKLLIGLIVLFICFKITNSIAKRTKKNLEKRGKDKTLTLVVYKCIRYGLKIVFTLLFLGYVGIDTAGVGTIIASFGVAVGLALQGSLSNLAGGIIILVMRPFKIGDCVEAQGFIGNIEEIHIFYTELITFDNRVVHLPNGSLANGSIVNYSQKDTRRVDMTFSISYDDDFEKAKSVIRGLCAENTKILNEPEPFVRVITHGESSIDIVVRVWTKSADYWDVYFAMMENVKTAFDQNSIEIPYNKLDVNIKEHSND